MGDRLTAAAMVMLTPQMWDRQLVTVAGVTMTNAERQAARRRILDDPEQAIRWLRERGLLQAGEEQDFLHSLRRMTEIDEMRRTNGGRVSPELEDEYRRHQQRFGEAADEATAQYQEDAGFSAEQQAGAEVASTVTRSENSDQQADFYRSLVAPAIPIDHQPVQAGTEDRLFPAAPMLAHAWDAAQAASIPLDHRSEQSPTPADPAMAGSGFAF